MTFRKLSCVLVLATAACAHQARVPSTPKLELRELCDQPASRALCTPVPAHDAGNDTFVDTNLTAPAAHATLAG
jgi:hypothetical protein